MPVLYTDQTEELIDGINNQIEERSSNTRTYSFIIDHTMTDPATMIYYADDTGCEAMSTEWFGLLGIRPCVVKNGAVLYYLNPNNFDQKADGTAADLTTLGNDVMIEIPKMGVKGVWISQEKLKVSITTARHARDFDYSAFSNTSYNDSDYLYVGVYKSYCEDNKMYSSKGKTITASQTLATYRTWAQNRGTGYYDVSYAVDELLSVLYCLIVRNLNSQAAIGPGHSNGSNTAPLPTGGSEAYGMLNQLATDTQKGDSGYHVKCLGIEDMWSNIWQWEDGIIKTASAEHSTAGEHCTILRAKTHSAMNSDGTNYIPVVNILFGYSYESGGEYHENGYVTRMNGTTGAIFIPCRGGGTSSTYYTDFHSINEDIMTNARSYGSWNVDAYAGSFLRHLLDDSSKDRDFIASRSTIKTTIHSTRTHTITMMISVLFLVLAAAGLIN